ncbi:MAG TPA: LysR family transcriptional regulator [Polyangiales bacterium]|nr:LysR family transcriptional regulator [Polyangiales bacterium]
MPGNELSRIDLNLLWALHVLLEEASVTAAAARLHVGQPAVSNQLARLRELLADPLLVRDGRRLVRTPRAEALRAPLTAAVSGIERVLLGDASFDAARESRCFVLSGDDAVEVTDVPLILKAMERALPRASLRVVSISRMIAAGGIASPEIDVALGPRAAFPAGRFTPLYRQGALLAFRTGHPLAKKKLTRERFNTLRFVDTWIADGRPGEGHKQVSGQLAEHGFVRQVALTVSHFSAAASAAAESDLVAGLPERVARYYAKYMPLTLTGFPAPLTFELEMGLGWHDRTHGDPACKFFRALVVRALATTTSRAGTRGR